MVFRVLTPTKEQGAPHLCYLLVFEVLRFKELCSCVSKLLWNG